MTVVLASAPGGEWAVVEVLVVVVKRLLNTCFAAVFAYQAYYFSLSLYVCLTLVWWVADGDNEEGQESQATLQPCCCFSFPQDSRSEFLVYVKHGCFKMFVRK